MWPLEFGLWSPRLWCVPLSLVDEPRFAVAYQFAVMDSHACGVGVMALVWPLSWAYGFPRSGVTTLVGVFDCNASVSPETTPGETTVK